MKTKTMLSCALFAAFICVFSVVTIPVGTVPVTLSTFAVMLCALVLGVKRGTISILIYIFIGAIGIPVFSGCRGGLGILFGPTGGYIWSYAFMALIIGGFAKKNRTIFKKIIACILGIIICYVFGTVQFVLVQKTDVLSAIVLCVVPFVVLDVLKAVAASYVSYKILKLLKKSGIGEF